MSIGNLGKTDLDTGHGEVRNFKLDLDWRLAFCVLSLYGGQAEVGPHHKLFTALKQGNDIMRNKAMLS